MLALIIAWAARAVQEASAALTRFLVAGTRKGALHVLLCETAFCEKWGGEKMATINAGDYVRHKMGGRTMVVAYLTQDINGLDQAECEWLDADEDVATKTFYTTVLQKQDADDETEAAIEIVITIFVRFANVQRIEKNEPEMSEEEEASYRTKWRDALAAMRDSVTPADAIRALTLIRDVTGLLT